MTNLIFSQNDSGLFSDSYTYLKYSIDIIPADLNFNIVKPEVLSLSGSTLNINYFNDPTFGYNEDFSKLHVNGTSLMFIISNCSGIYSSNSISLSSWNPIINGISIDTIKRSDMSFTYNGDYKVFSENVVTKSGYWAYGNNIEVSLNYNGINLLYGSSSQIIKPIIYDYDTTGVFKMNLILNLDFNSVSSPYTYTDPNFSLSGCILDIKMYDKNNIIKANKSYSNVNINFPDIDGSIIVDNNITKTIDDVVFYVSRNANIRDTNYTELHNIKKQTYNIIKNSFYEENYQSYLNNNVYADNIIIPNSSLNRGDYCFISYEPKLFGIRSGIKNNTAITDYVTNCKGHKYFISGVALNMSISGVYGDDILDLISEQNPYIFIDSANNSGHLQVNFSATHENWTTNTNRDNLQESGIYPFISQLYLIATQNNYIETTLRVRQSTFNSYDDELTYPNVDITYTTLLSILGMENLYYSQSSLSGTDISLTSQSINVNILKSGSYKVYLAVVDEFDQVSLWCITNKSKNFNFSAGY
ncbi:MAG: hypothetical protein M0R17_02540 [Candidatus Omnitrophica bacterium]|jgi:hypothetical protein|nr:hypothetical protein [Candidatus Omnitrophota bacterium]